VPSFVNRLVSDEAFWGRFEISLPVYNRGDGVGEIRGVECEPQAWFWDFPNDDYDQA